LKNILNIIIIFVCIFAFSCNVFAKTKTIGDINMSIENIKQQDRVLDYFIQLAEIPSPSLKEEKVANKIIKILSSKGIAVQKDNYGNVIAKLDANNSDKEPILLSAHMDVVGSDSPVNIRISADGKYLETDKTRTLGADNKAGVALILDVLSYFKEHPEIHHPMIEATFTRDEENGMSGAHNLDTSLITSQNALMLDGNDLGDCNISGASFTNLTVKVTDGKSGHSGNDIGDETRISANKVLAEIVNAIPQGVYKKDKFGVVTSINSGAIVGGSTGLYLMNEKDIENLNDANKIMDTIADNAYRNIISANAYVNYSIRSSEPENESKLKNEISNIIDKISKKYENNIKINYIFESHLPPFVKVCDDKFLDIIITAAKKNGMNPTPTSFHAGAETHVLQNEKLNKDGKHFKPLLLGIANILNMHSYDEKLDYKSLITGRNWVIDIITAE